MAHICKRCGYSATTKASLIRHLQSKSPCQTKENNIAREVLIEQLQNREHKTDTTHCPMCNKLLAKTNLARHKKVCKENTQSNNTIQVSAETIHNLQAQIDKLSKDQATSSEVSQHLQSQINELRSELNTHKNSGIHLNQELQIHEHDSRLVENENVSTPIKTRKSKISQAIRIVCWNTYIGEEIGKAQCVCCKTNFITQHNFHCGHVIAEANGGKVQVNNLRPICAVCNNSMGTMSMKEFALNNFNIEI
jgi:hypothetical protein